MDGNSNTNDILHMEKNSQEVMIINNRKNVETKEIEYEAFSGCVMLLLNLLLFIGSIAFIIIPPIFEVFWCFAISFPLFITSFILWFGFFTLEPNEAAVVVLYGTYKGTVKQMGFHWINPFTSVTRVLLRSQNLNGDIIKVNDNMGNPIEISVVIVWRVKDTAKAIFDVIDYVNFVRVNSDSAVRHLALCYPYDKIGENEVCLRSGHPMVISQLTSELTDRLSRAGIDVEEARINHLAYAPEIANAMLRRQQAEAVIAAREKIVQGAVSIVGHALTALHQNGIVDMSNEEKARLVSNMLVVLCSESQVNPVVNTGSAS